MSIWLSTLTTAENHKQLQFLVKNNHVLKRLNFSHRYEVIFSDTFALESVNCTVSHLARQRTETQLQTGYTAVVKQVDAWWIGWIEELPGVNCQDPPTRNWSQVCGKPFVKHWN